MTTPQSVAEKILADFREEYTAYYRGILPEDILEKGNPWFEQRLLHAMSEAIVAAAGEEMKCACEIKAGIKPTFCEHTIGTELAGWNVHIRNMRKVADTISNKIQST